MNGLHQFLFISLVTIAPYVELSWNSLQARLCRSCRQAQPAQGPKPFIHKSFRLLYVKDEKNKELGGQGKTQVQWRLWWKALIHHFHPRSNDRVSTDLTSRNFFFAPAPLYLLTFAYLIQKVIQVLENKLVIIFIITSIALFPKYLS